MTQAAAHPASQFDLTGRYALVVGGSRGMGRSMALGLARAGADVMVASRNMSSPERHLGRTMPSGRWESTVSRSASAKAEENALMRMKTLACWHAISPVSSATAVMWRWLAWTSTRWPTSLGSSE